MNAEPHAFDFKVGERLYYVKRDDRRGTGYAIISNGDIVEFVSASHYGEIDAFRRIAERMRAIEDEWLKAN